MLRNADQTLAVLNMIDSLRHDFPNDVDYRFALEELSIAYDLAPQYEDVWRLRFPLLQANHSSDTAQQHVAANMNWNRSRVTRILQMMGRDNQSS